MHLVKFSNCVSLVFLGFAIFFFFFLSNQKMADSDETSKSIYDFTVKVFSFLIHLFTTSF